MHRMFEHLLQKFARREHKNNFRKVYRSVFHYRLVVCEAVLVYCGWDLVFGWANRSDQAESLVNAFVQLKVGINKNKGATLLACADADRDLLYRP